MATKIQLRRDTAANWTSANPTLSAGELGYESDTDKVKVGDGITAWTSLAYLINGTAGAGTDLTAFSVTNNTAADPSNLSYNTNTGEFTYTPPVIPTDISELTDNTALIPDVIDFSTINVTITDETDPQSISDALNELVTQIQGLGV